MDFKKIATALLLAKVTLSCTEQENRINANQNKNKDPFYIEDSGYDYIRFPLIKPYEVRSLNKGKEWDINGEPEAKTIQETNRIHGVKKINFIQNFIICYCEGIRKVGQKEYPIAIISGERYSQAWFIIIPEKNINKGFTTEEEFIMYLQEQGIEKEQIQWKTPDELFKEFSDTYCLPWIPNCSS